MLTLYVTVLLLTVHYTYKHVLCIVAIVDCTHVVYLFKKTEHLTAPISDHPQLW